MEVRPKSTKPARPDKNSSNSRKHKKRGNKKNIARVDSWCDEEQSEMNGGIMSSVDYGPMFWPQTGVPPHMQPPYNSQRLFTAMSDPTVCDYSTVPVAYTMEPVSMPPIYPLYRPVPRPNYRAFRGRPRINPIQNQNAPHVNQQSNIVNGYSSLQDNRSNYLTPTLHQNGDYTSLPPTANNHIPNDAEELNSEHRRYSDPGLGPTDLPPYANSDDSDSEDSGSSITTIGKNNKFVLTLVEQMTTLREANSQMFRELHETKLSLENMKAELIRVKQYASLDYQPGMLSDIISEMRAANKILNETIMTKVNAIMEERSHHKFIEIDDVKARLAKMTEEKAEVDKRITKLEEDVAGLKVNLNDEDHKIAAFEEETLVLRRELQETRASMNNIDSHATKCVVASIASPIMPVNFNTPCITSTPVRTDVYDSCRTSTAGCQASSSSTSSTSSPLPSLSLSNSLRSVKSIDGAEIDEDWCWTQCALPNSRLERASNLSRFIEKANSIKLKESKSDVTTNVQQSVEKNNKKQQSIEEIVFSQENAPTIIEEPMEQSAQRFLRENNYVDSSTNKLLHLPCMGPAITSTVLVKTDEDDENSIRMGNDNNSSSISRKDDITEIPDVVFVAGKSVIPKHLYSTRILSSRVLTAPSRATYTTAYI